MNIGSVLTAFFLLMAAGSALAQEGRERGRMTDEPQGVIGLRQEVAVEGDQAQLIINAVNTYGRLQYPQGIAEAARCVAIFPEVTKAALLAGGRHGDGVATCKGDQDKWSRIGFIDLIGASFGAQLGAKQSSLVMFFLDPNAQRKLQDGRLELGADASVVLGAADADADIATNRRDVYAFAESAGVFAGAALDGVVLQADADELREFYNQPVTITQTLTTVYSPKTDPKEIANLVTLLPGGQSQAKGTKQ